jgi:hypothetical protein
MAVGWEPGFEAGKLDRSLGRLELPGQRNGFVFFWNGHNPITANKQMESLREKDLQRAKDSDEERKRQYEAGRNRILTQQGDFRCRWRGGWYLLYAVLPLKWKQGRRTRSHIRKALSHKIGS